MKIGLVTPYSFDVPGGVQLHVRDLAEYLDGAGHEVAVLAPADEDSPGPEYVTRVPGAVPIRYNGSVARLAFGPRTASKVARWLEAGDFDVLHVHEPFSPSLSMLALWAWGGPVVATFHTATERSRALQLAGPILRPGLEKITARIAVSEQARRTLVEHFGGDAVVIPNGVYVDRLSEAGVCGAWRGTEESPTIAFLGRVEEPRKGFSLLVETLPTLLQRHPGLRVLVAGPGGVREALRDAPPAVQAAVEPLGVLSEHAKARLLASVDAYVAPNLGGESFGIILIEAMSAYAPVVASDLDAFAAVLDQGQAGVLFETGDATSLSEALGRVLGDSALREALKVRGRKRAETFDWSRVAHRILNVYSTVIAAHNPERTPWRLYGRG